MLDDGLDTRVPVYSDEVFKHGIHFCCKKIDEIVNNLFKNEKLSKALLLRNVLGTLTTRRLDVEKAI
ncbi:hypothetical protein ACTXT7_003847 [Hymenolepis weldensis]